MLQKYVKSTTNYNFNIIFQLRGFPEAPKHLVFEDLTNGVFLHNILQNL